MLVNSDATMAFTRARLRIYDSGGLNGAAQQVVCTAA
jgi:hypothetical protein